MAVWAHVRQCERSLSFHWHDDPPQQVRALLHNLLYNAPALVVILLHFVVALQRHRRRPRIELVALQQLRPVVRFPCCHRSSDQCACQVQTATVRRLICQSFAQFSCRRRVLQKALRKHRVGCYALSHLVFEFVRTQASRQFALEAPITRKAGSSPYSHLNCNISGRSVMCAALRRLPPLPVTNELSCFLHLERS